MYLSTKISWIILYYFGIYLASIVETGSPCCAGFTSTDGPKGPSSALCCVPKMGQCGSLDVDGTMWKKRSISWNDFDIFLDVFSIDWNLLLNHPVRTYLYVRIFAENAPAKQPTKTKEATTDSKFLVVLGSSFRLLLGLTWPLPSGMNAAAWCATHQFLFQDSVWTMKASCANCCANHAAPRSLAQKTTWGEDMSSGQDFFKRNMDFGLKRVTCKMMQPFIIIIIFVNLNSAPGSKII